MSMDDRVPTHGHQQHLIWNSFNKYMEIHVQIKYERSMMMTFLTIYLHKV